MYTDLIKMMQCESCENNLKDFIEAMEIRKEETKELLAAYTLFCEMRRLKEQTKPSNLFPTTGIRTMPYDSPFVYQKGGKIGDSISITC